MALQEYYRRPFVVEAWRLTEEELPLIAKWCNGKVKGLSITFPKIRDKTKILDAQERHSFAVLGDVIIKTHKGFVVMGGVEFDSKYQQFALRV